MKIKNGIENKPVLTGVGDTGEFRIRNSAKAFSILSSGLYANKIRAIIREYSCNAVDSHIEAGKADVPFDVHLPTSLEPWFSIRDYGVGLDDVQVRDIFTTYFESTKTGTDDLIGGLGLGSKSAFSYTENFTITAIKNGMKRVFTAFINSEGVPSIALMGQEESSEPTGVEIRFAVEDTHDFRKFYDEARHVYRHFKLRPVVSGTGFTFDDVEYSERDIIPGVHIRGRADSYYGAASVAIMGNIEYPIELPSHQTEYSDLLKCGLVMEFGIGELDIQASREGLSYIPETVAAINAKLEQLNNSLSGILKTEVDKIKNPWEKAFFLVNKSKYRLWANAIEDLVRNDPNLLVKITPYGNVSTKDFSFADKVIGKRYNIELTYIRHNGYRGKKVSTRKSRYNYTAHKQEYIETITLDPNTRFVIKDVKVGITNRVHQHWTNEKIPGEIYILSPLDKNKPMKTEQFFKAIKNPPKSYIFKASELNIVERKKTRSVAMILKLEKRGTNKYYKCNNDYVWREAGKSDSFDNTKTYYYFPLSGFIYQGEGKFFDITEFVRQLDVSGIRGVDTIYGVRKSQIDYIKSLPNWVNLDDYIKEQLANVKVNTMGLVKERIGFDNYYNVDSILDELDDSSPFKKLWLELANVTTDSSNRISALNYLAKMYDLNIDGTDIEPLFQEYNNKLEDVRNRYPLYEVSKSLYCVDYKDLAEYIAAIDMLKATKKIEEKEENIEG